MTVGDPGHTSFLSWRIFLLNPCGYGLGRASALGDHQFDHGIKNVCACPSITSTVTYKSSPSGAARFTYLLGCFWHFAVDHNDRCSLDQLGCLSVFQNDVEAWIRQTCSGWDGGMFGSLWNRKSWWIEIRKLHQLSLIVYPFMPIIYVGFWTCQVVGQISEPSTAPVLLGAHWY